MLDSQSLQEPATRNLRPNDDVAARGIASWFIPPVVVPIFLLVSVVTYGLYRLLNFGPAAFN